MVDLVVDVYGGDGAEEVSGAGVAVARSHFDAGALGKDKPITNRTPMAL